MTHIFLALENLLQKGQAFSGVYRAQLSNHLPMALIALHRLGADEARLEQFFKMYSGRLEMKSITGLPLSPDTWTERLGQHQYHADFTQFFAQELNRLGMEETLITYGPKLMPGVGGGAFHGLIRLAYGVDIGSPHEIAEGLAHWADAYLPLKTTAAISDSSVPYQEILEAFRRDRKWSELDIGGPTIFTRMARVAAEPEFQSLAGSVQGADLELRDLARSALAIYAATNDFTALHLVTSCHAMRLVLPYCRNQGEALASYWMAFAAGYITIGCPAFNDLDWSAHDGPSWEEIAARAVLSHDDHTIKLVYTCRTEEEFYQEPVYRKIAGLRVRL